MTKKMYINKNIVPDKEGSGNIKDPLDNITFKILGDFGKWQLKIAILMALLKLPMAWYQLNILFLAPQQTFWCVKPSTFSQYTDEEWRDMCAPKIEEHPCLIFDPDILSAAPMMDRALIPLVACKEFVYDTSVFTRTIISDWNLVCKRHWLIHFTQAVMMWGVVIGGIFFPMWADKHGRKNPLMAGIVIQCVAAFFTSFLNQFWLFLISWFVLAVSTGGLGVITFVMSMEVVSGKWRTVIPILYQMPFGIGNTILAGLAYLLRNWRHLEFVLAILSSIFLVYYFFIEDSPRWLLATGHNKRACEILKKAAIVNGREEIFESMKHSIINQKVNKRKTPGFSAFMKSEYMRKNTVLLSMNWFCTGLSFFTFSQYLGYIGSNIYLAISLTGLISIPGCLLCLVVITRFGRKTTVWVFQSISSACFLLILVIPKELFANDWPRLVAAAVGFAGLSGAVPALYLYSGELFPTLGRNAGVGGVTTFARIASMVAPGLVTLDEVFADLPLIILAVVSLFQLTLLIPLPETKGLPLPDTLEDAEIQSMKRARNNKRRKTEEIKLVDR